MIIPVSVLHVMSRFDKLVGKSQNIVLNVFCVYSTPSSAAAAAAFPLAIDEQIRINLLFIHFEI